MNKNDESRLGEFLGGGLNWMMQKLRGFGYRLGFQAFAAHLAVIEKSFGIKAGDYEEPARLAEKIGGAEPHLVSLYIAYEHQDRPRHGLAMFLAELGLGWRDLERPLELARALMQRTARMASRDGLSYRIAFARALFRCHFQEQICDLYDQFLELPSGEPWERKALLGKFEHLQDHSSPVLAQAFLMQWILALAACRRYEQMLTVLESAFAIQEEDYREPQTIIAILDRGALGSGWAARELMLSGLATAWLSRGRRDRAQALIEADWGIVAADFADHRLLFSKVRRRLDELMAFPAPLNFTLAMNYAAQLITSSGTLDFPLPHREKLLSRAVYLALDRHLGKNEIAKLIDYLGRDLAGRSAARFRAHSALLLPLIYSPGHGLAGAVEYLEHAGGLEPGDYRSPAALADKLVATASEPESIPFLVSTLIAFKLRADRPVEARMLCEAFLQRLTFLGERSDDAVIVGAIVAIYQRWILLAGREDGRRFGEVCRQIVEFLRGSFKDQGIALADRLDFVREAESLRRSVLGTAYWWAEQPGEASRAQQWLVDLLAWDAELSQRVIVERYLTGRIASIPPGAPPSPEPPDSGDAMTLSLAAYLEEKAERPGRVPEPPERAAGIGLPLDGGEAELLRRIIDQGADASVIAAALGAGGLLVRASFDEKGCLRWSAFRTGGPADRHLEAVVHGSSVGSLLQPLRGLLARHDFQMAVLRSSSGNGKPSFPILLATLESHLASLEAAALDTDGSGEGIVPALLQAFSKLERHSASPAVGILKDACRPWLALEPDPDDPELRPQDLQRELKALRATIANIRRDGADGSPAALDRATAALLAEVVMLWPVDALAPFLAPETEVVFQVDDALHGIPLAYLPVAGQPLCRRVASVRTSWSILFELVQRRAESAATEARGGRERLLSISHFEPGEHNSDELQSCAKVLHREQWRLAQVFGLECWMAGEYPPGSAAVIARALADPHFYSAVSICGHGTTRQPGVRLADELWNGCGCDLSRVGWLHMICCSLGHIAQTGDRDVAGFCVELAVHRARSILACRWPVSAPQAIRFASQVLETFLATGGVAPRARSRALNAVRLQWLDGAAGLPGGASGLNTAAAFELFGLG